MPFFRSTKLLPIENNSNCIRSWCLSSVGITKLSAHTVTQQHELRGGLHLHYLERERRSEWLSVCRRGMSNTQKKTSSATQTFSMIKKERTEIEQEQEQEQEQENSPDYTIYTI